MGILMLSGLLAATVGLAQGFNDGFDRDALDARWEWSTPKAGPTWSLAANPGHLRITVPQSPGGFSHWIGDARADAPLLLTAAPEGDFALEARLQVVEHGPDSNFHLALAVAFSKRYLVGWGPFFAPALGNPRERPEVWCEPSGQAHHVAVQAEVSDVFLRIVKTGRSYRFLLKRTVDGQWTEEGEWACPWPPKYVGLMCKSFGDGPAVVADLEYVSLEPGAAAQVEPLTAAVTVDCAAQSWPLDRRRFGHFIEHLDGCIYGGIWAEMLHNRKFTGRAGPAGVVDGWKPVGAGPQARFSRDNAIFYAPCQSQRIEVGQATEPVGVMQDGLELRPGVACKVRLVARHQGLQTPVLVALRDPEGNLVSQVELGDIGDDWAVREFELAGPAQATGASFSLTTPGPGFLWLGAVSLMPADNVEGMRADVLEAIREIKPPIVRWPGGNFVSGYDWRDGIGERDRRPPRWDRAWNAWEWNDFGTDEFLRFCDLVDTEPYICVNSGEGMAPEAAAWVEYCNGPATSRWGKLRAGNGYPEPYGIQVWGIGNEMYGDWQLGHLSPTNYGLKAVEFSQAMRAVDPAIKLVGVGVDGGGWHDWNREVCRIAGAHFDWLSVHYYLGLPHADPVLNYAQALGAPAQVERMLEQSWELATEGAGKPIPLAFDEWNIWLPTKEYTLRDGLFACLVFNALNRLGDKCPMANLAQLVNVLGAIYTDKTQTVRTPLHAAFEMYGEVAGDLGVPVAVQTPAFHFPQAGALAAVDVTAALTTDRKVLSVALVNRMPGDAVTLRLSLAGFEAADRVGVLRLDGPTAETANTLQQPGGVELARTEMTLTQALAAALPAHSATIMVFEAK